jgi:hypothetical protein
MGNTTFTGAVRSESGFQGVTKNTTTGAVTVNNEFGSIATLPTEAGTGITTGTGTIYASSITEQGGIITTQIMIDVTGLRSTGVGDIIGVNGTALVCHIGQITAARNGTILGGSITCLEAPTGGEPDIDVYSATEGTGVEDGAIGDLTETQLVNTGDHTIGLVSTLTAVPAADEYLYLVAQGAGTDADYTAGKFMIELRGYRA